MIAKMNGFSYLTQAQLDGFKRYKYSSVDSSPLSKYVMHPFWNAIVKLVPRWVAPNVLTFTGGILLVLSFCLLSYYDWDYRGVASNPSQCPIPPWVWLVCAALMLASHTLDGIDGKQAKRTGSSSPLGELFDHGIDSWSVFLITMTFYSNGGYGRWENGVDNALLPFIATIAGFYVTHWEKYITGTLYLPWFYDISLLSITLGNALTFLYGVELYWIYVLPGLELRHAIKWITVLGFFLNLIVSLWNIYVYYSRTGIVQNSTRKLSLLEALAPWTPTVTLFLLSTVWICLSPTDIISRDPRITLLSVGLVFSNITCRLIISQMSGQCCEQFNYLLLLQAMALAGSVLNPRYELLILYSFAAVVLLAHIHYGVSVVQELCTHLSVRCFIVKEATTK